jgi:hypothetical protein
MTADQARELAEKLGGGWRWADGAVRPLPVVEIVLTETEAQRLADRLESKHGSERPQDAPTSDLP